MASRISRLKHRRRRLEMISDIVYDRCAFKNKGELELVMLDALAYVQTYKRANILELYGSIRKLLLLLYISGIMSLHSENRFL